MSMNDVKSLSHSKWRCKYHIVFAPKYRRQIIYGRIKADVGKILRDLCKRKNVEIIEADNFVALAQQLLAQKASHQSGAASDENCFVLPVVTHVLLLYNRSVF